MAHVFDTFAPPSAAPGDAARKATAVAARVLVVDDNVDSAETLGVLLRIYGHEVHVVHDGFQALDDLDAFHPDVAILDIGMPEMNGYTVARRMRERLGDATPLLIAVTGWGQEEDRRRSKAAGFDHHFVKPVDPAALAAVIAARARKRVLH